MLKPHYAVTTDIARVYKVRERGRQGWGWAIATIREWRGGGQIDVQSDFGSYAYTWTAIGDRSLREFLCDLSFDYFMNKAMGGSYELFDEGKTINSIKAEIFRLRESGVIDRRIAHEWRDDVDDCGDAGSEHLFAERLMRCDWFNKVFDVYPPIETVDNPQARAFWDGPWQALCTHWRQELDLQKRVAA
ncbi:hypothetical protein [Filomicrobium sp.]|uniref:hypothetical protein n=1 Tax=Filomicrobium sp. TaxID=2024831 RepID=UPI002585EFD0|nr:hypothetical protein [Filomicrobium sp.]MCV0371118.1 hypothetical protein [Filomicrobium sp.]